MENNNNLPMKVDNGLSIENKRNIRRMGEKFKKIGKVTLNLGVSVVGIGLAALTTAPIMSVIGAGIFAVGTTNAISKTIYKKYNDMLFMTRRNLKGEQLIFQDVLDTRGLKIMVKFEAGEKAALMGMQTLVGLQRYKQEAGDKNKKKIQVEGKDYNVYNTVFSTLTHGVNIKTFQNLNDLGYIHIDSLEDKGQKSLAVEKLLFGQLNAKGIVKNIFQREPIAEKVKMQQIKFRLTDKPFDLEQLYNEYLKLKASKNDNNKERLEKINSIIRIPRILKNRNIDIEKDELGMTKINYHADKSFSERIESTKRKKENKFFEELKVDHSKDRQQQIEPELNEPNRKIERIDDERDF